MWTEVSMKVGSTGGYRAFVEVYGDAPPLLEDRPIPALNPVFANASQKAFPMVPTVGAASPKAPIAPKRTFDGFYSMGKLRFPCCRGCQSRGRNGFPCRSGRPHRQRGVL